MNPEAYILKMRVHIINIEQTFNQIVNLTNLSNSAYVCVSNVHMCMEVFDSPDFEKIVNQADLVIPDGKPLSWAQKLLGYKGAQQVRGQDIMNALCAASGEQHLNIGFYGGSSEDLLDTVQEKLKLNYSDINITYAYSPPFRPLTETEDANVISAINQANVNILFVGIGCPKQERWMAEHKNELNCVMLGVGAAFDFIAGSKKHAPIWIQKIGMEWLFRLLSEPNRLWKRYLKQNPRFIWYFIQQWIFKKKFS